LPHRVLYACETAQISGAEIVLLNLIGSINRSLYEPRALCPPGGPLRPRLADLAVPAQVIRFPRLRRTLRSAALELPRLRGFSRRLRTYLRQQQIDIVHANSWGAHIACASAAVECGAITVWHMHSIFRRRWPNGWALRAAARSADRIICVSHAVARELEAWGIPAAKLTVICNGLDLDERFQPRPPTGLLHSQYGLPADAQLVATIGQLTPGKGQDLFIRAAASIAAAHPRAVFLVVGAPLFGDQRWPRHLQRLAQQLGIQDRVMFTGTRDDMPRVLAEVRFVVHASVAADSLPTVLMEAGAMAKPAIATVSGGAPEIIEDHRTGLLVPPGDAEAMAAAMDRLLSDAETAAAMGAAARRVIEQRFTIGQYVRQVEELYRELLLAPVAASSDRPHGAAGKVMSGGRDPNAPQRPGENKR